MTRKQIIRAILLALFLLIIILVIIIVVKTYSHPFAKSTENDGRQAVAVEISDAALRRFAGGIRIPTVSNAEYDETNFEPFERFGNYLREQYPRVYENLETQTINTYGLVFHWKGKNPQLKPLLFLSHYDVVPVVGYEPETAPVADSIFRRDQTAQPFTENITSWDYPPFSGAVADGRIWGRGTLDMKCMLFSVMEGVDQLLEEGFQPERDIWIAFGQDEEVSGRQGAFVIAQHFKDQGLQFEAVYDEGGVIYAQGFGKSAQPVALIGIAEKGFLTLKISVNGVGGHASMPPAKGSLVQAAEIIEKLNNNQMPARLISPVKTFLDNVSGEQGFMTRMAVANQWLFKPMLLKTFSKEPATNALIRTTTAVTMAKGSDAANVLSSVSEITVNFRLLPGDTVDDVIAHVEKLCDGYDVRIENFSSREASGISPVDTRGFEIISEVLADIYPQAKATSYITIGGTDAYKYQIVSDNIYRFMPLFLNEYEQRVIHNENESITIDNYGKLVYYFREVMRRYDN